MAAGKLSSLAVEQALLSGLGPAAGLDLMKMDSPDSISCQAKKGQASSRQKVSAKAGG